MSTENQRYFLSFRKRNLILMVLGSKIFFVEDKYGDKRVTHFQVVFIAQTIIFSFSGKKWPYWHPSF